VRPVVQEVAKVITQRCVVMAHKTKAKAEGGKQLVSVGPYVKAVGSRGYIVIGKRWEQEYPSARTAAQAFVDFVGRDVAWEAVKFPKCPGR
jgi:hypothetical protein